eukprot:c18155_g1_i1 orf=119-544(+)
MAMDILQYPKAIVSHASALHFRAASQKRPVTCTPYASTRSGKGGKGQEQSSAAGVPASSKDLKIALGIDRDDTKLSQKPAMRAFMEKLEETADTLTEFEEEGTYQERALQFVIAMFPVWLLYVLVAAGAIQLPFRLPFLDN